MLVNKVFQEPRRSESQEFRSRGQGVLDKESSTRSSSTRSAVGMELRQRVGDKEFVDKRRPGVSGGQDLRRLGFQEAKEFRRPARRDRSRSLGRRDRSQVGRDRSPVRRDKSLARRVRSRSRRDRSPARREKER